jgi:hypothetical protein
MEPNGALEMFRSLAVTHFEYGKQSPNLPTFRNPHGCDCALFLGSCKRYPFQIPIWVNPSLPETIIFRGVCTHKQETTTRQDTSYWSNVCLCIILRMELLWQKTLIYSIEGIIDKLNMRSFKRKTSFILSYISRLGRLKSCELWRWRSVPSYE